MGCYRTGDANDPETYVAAITATLARYPEEVITAVTHPSSGIIVEVKWLPSVMEVREACEREMLPIKTKLAREQRIAEQMEARRIEDEQKPTKPSYDDLKAKYGSDWGITVAEQKRGPPAPAPSIEQLRHHYQHYDLSFRPKAEGNVQ